MLLTMELPGEVAVSLAALHPDKTAVVLSLVGIYLARLSGNSACSFAFSDRRIGAARMPASLFADRFPIDVDLNAASFADVVGNVATQQQAASARAPFF